MAKVGSQADFTNRLYSTLPTGWFPAESSLSGVVAPIANSILNGSAAILSWNYALNSYVKSQDRLYSAQDIWLDVFALDYFNLGLKRKTNEGDSVYRARIKANLLEPKGTREAVIQAVTNLTGEVPQVFEPANTQDTGGYGTNEIPKWSGLAYGFAGGYGSLKLPFQAFITVVRPLTNSAGYTAGYYYGSGWGGGGYGYGAIQYIGLDQLSAQMEDSDIYSTVANVAPAGTIMWVKIVSATINS